MIGHVIENREFIDELLSEIKPNVTAAHLYMHKNIEEMFPEISKSIQHRRAQYYLLIHEYHFID